MAKKKSTGDSLREDARERLSQLGYQQIDTDFALFDPARRRIDGRRRRKWSLATRANP